jgi:hypothetical protein
VKTTEILDMTIPEYAVIWSKGDDAVASVWFLEPGKELWQLRVEDPSYLLRSSITNGLTLEFPELVPPSSPPAKSTNLPPGTFNLPATKDR